LPHNAGQMSLLKNTLAPALLLLAGCSQGIPSDRAYGPAVPVSTPAHPVEIHLPKTQGVLDTNLRDIAGTPVGVSCKTCHGSQAQGGLLNKEAPANFHSGLKIHHGSMSCASCHDQDRSRLHLADGKKLEFDQTAKLCAQCHGVQFRDYTRGSHGGMTGYWDLRRGPRERNTCTDCHAAHHPAFERVRPVHPPKDRFLDWKVKEPKNHE
jgi:hypothetical protein